MTTRALGTLTLRLPVATLAATPAATLAAALAATLAAALAVAPPAHAVCCPFPPIGGSLNSTGQTNLIVLDGEAGTVTVVPNVALTGEGRTLALVVPTPSVPTLAPASSDLWADARLLMTANIGTRPAADGPFGCSTTDVAVTAPDPVPQGGVIILGEETVGAFAATTLTAGSATALVDWLTANDFGYTAADSAAFAPYVARDWIFTAMKLDSTAAELPPTGTWNVGLDPVAITFDAAALEVPLPILAINRSARFDLTFLVVADRRMALDGFDTLYANRLSAGELHAIRNRAPTLGAYLDEGRFLVNLHRGFQLTDAMSASLMLAPAATNDEVIPGRPVTGGVPVGPVLLLVIGACSAVLAARRRSRRRT